MFDFSCSTDCVLGSAEAFATVVSGLRNKSTIDSQAIAPKAMPPANPPANSFQSLGQREAAAGAVGDDIADTGAVIAAFATGAGAATGGATLVGAILVVGAPTIAAAATALGKGGRPVIDEIALSGFVAGRCGSTGGMPATFFAARSSCATRLVGAVASPGRICSPP